MNGKGLLFLRIHGSDIFDYHMQVGYDVLMFDFFIEKNLPREEKIVSIIPDGMPEYMVLIYLITICRLATMY
jgi:hypothetical protein